MPVRVHALLVVHADSNTWHLERTIRAVRSQTRSVDALTVVTCGRLPATLESLVRESGAEGVIAASRGTSFAHAIALAAHRLGNADAIWLLAQDTAPGPDALERLTGALEVQPSATVFAPKLIAWTDPGRIVSLGVSMTRYGRSVELVDGQLDQGQHDIAHDALGADVRGLLVRRTAWDTVGGLDPALAGADEGLDLSVRSRLAHGRAILVPGARVAVAGAGVAGLPDPDEPAARRHRSYARRTAELHRRLAYAPALAVPVHWLLIPVLAVLRTVMHLVRKAPGDVLTEWAASATVWVRLAAIARSRSRIRAASGRAGSRVPWSQLAPLRVTRSALARRLDGPDGEPDEAPARGELHFFIGGGAWVVLAALVVGLTGFVTLLAWPTLGGGALLPLQSTVEALWADAAYGRRAIGLDVVAPADPFAALVAVLGSLTAWHPSQALIVLWVLALPLAALGGWFATTRLSDRAGIRIAGAVLWTLAPTFLTALIEGRPAAVLVHLLLPWLMWSGSVARRSWTSAALAAILFAAVGACAPSLLPALLLLWLVSLVSARSGFARIAFVPVLAIALFAPLVWVRGFGEGDWWGILADPGALLAVAQNGSDVTGRALLAAGFPTPDLASWLTFAPFGEWAWMLVLPLGALAVLSMFTSRPVTGLVLLGIWLLGVGTAIGQAHLIVQSWNGAEIALWPGSALSLGWFGLIGAALVTADAPTHRIARAVSNAGLIGAVVAVAALAIPGVSAPLRGESLLTNGPASTLPAYVAAVGREDDETGTIVLTPEAGGAVSAKVVWGPGETLGGQTTTVTTRAAPTPGDVRVAELAVDLVSPGAADPTKTLADRGIRFVLLAPARGDSDADSDTNEISRQGIAALNSRAGLDVVGDTGRGFLWRVTAELTPRAQLERADVATARTITIVQLAVLAVAVLLVIPTAASRRAARAYPRVLGASRSPRNGARASLVPPIALPSPSDTVETADLDTAGAATEGAETDSVEIEEVER